MYIYVRGFGFIITRGKEKKRGNFDFFFVLFFFKRGKNEIEIIQKKGINYLFAPPMPTPWSNEGIEAWVGLGGAGGAVLGVILLHLFFTFFEREIYRLKKFFASFFVRPIFSLLVQFLGFIHSHFCKRSSSRPNK